MNPRTGIGIMVCTFTIFGAQAQEVGVKDSLSTEKKENEIRLNPEAVKSIEFNFMGGSENLSLRPRMSEDKSWMKYREDLPKNFTDTVTWRKKEYVRAAPYTPYTRWDEDPINDPIFLKPDTLSIRMQLNMKKIKASSGMGHGYWVLPAGMDQSVTPSNRPLIGFSADKALYETFTKRGRAIRRNRKKAKAWRIYQDYTPTKEDSLKWWGNKKRIPKRDTLESKKDSTNYFINTK